MINRRLREYCRECLSPPLVSSPLTMDVPEKMQNAHVETPEEPQPTLTQTELTLDETEVGTECGETIVGTVCGESAAEDLDECQTEVDADDIADNLSQHNNQWAEMSMEMLKVSCTSMLSQSNHHHKYSFTKLQ